MGQVAFVLAAGSAVIGACSSNGTDAPHPGGVGAVGNKGYHPPFGLGGAGEGGAAGQGAQGTGADTQGGAGGEMAVEGAPIVTVTSPAGLTDPNKPGVLIDDQVDVFCTVTRSPAKGSKPVADSTVVMQMLDADGKVVPSEMEGTVAAERTSRPDEYTARFVTTLVPDNGKISFRCLGGDSSTPPRLGESTVTTFVDHGPLVKLKEPKSNSAHALVGALAVDFTVEPSPLAKGDTGAALDGVDLFVGGARVDAAAIHEVDGEYTAQITLTDNDMFPTTPSGDVPILVRATNRRKPDAVTRTVTDTFVVDGDGPDIMIDSPADRSLVGRTVPLKFRVTDPLTGVNRSKIHVTVNDEDSQFGDTTGQWKNPGENGDDSYVFTFDSTLINDSLALATINISAEDNAGNRSKVSLLLNLDDVPPIVDMDPLNVRAWRKDGSAYTCSESFDPLGEAINDLDPSANGFGLFRAWLWELTNESPNEIYAGVDDATVGFYVQPDPSKPFLINNPGDPDEHCDDISPDVIDDLEFVSLTPVPPNGGAPFDGAGATSAPDPAGFGCALGHDTTPPVKLCQEESSDMTVVLPQQKPNRDPAVYALSPENPVFCTGISWEIRTGGREGWICVATRALDKVGNVGISRPLRICYDNPQTSFVPDCSGEPPSCTDGCTPPPAFTNPDWLYVKQ